MTTLRRFGLVVACNVVALWVADLLVDGIRIHGFWKAVLAGVVLGIVNWFVRPIVRLLALPVIVLSLGIALFFVNLLMLTLAAWITPGFTISGFLAAVAGTVVIWLVNSILFAVFGIEDAQRRKPRRR